MSMSIGGFLSFERIFLEKTNKQTQSSHMLSTIVEAYLTNCTASNCSGWSALWAFWEGDRGTSTQDKNKHDGIITSTNALRVSGEQLLKVGKCADDSSSSSGISIFRLFSSSSSLRF